MVVIWLRAFHIAIVHTEYSSPPVGNQVQSGITGTSPLDAFGAAPEIMFPLAWPASLDKAIADYVASLVCFAGVGGARCGADGVRSTYTVVRICNV